MNVVQFVKQAVSEYRWYRDRKQEREQYLELLDPEQTSEEQFVEHLDAIREQALPQERKQPS